MKIIFFLHIHIVVLLQVRYSKAGLPELVIDGVETAVFEGDRIALLRDDFTSEAEATLAAWIKDNGAKL